MVEQLWAVNMCCSSYVRARINKSIDETSFFLQTWIYVEIGSDIIDMMHNYEFKQLSEKLSLSWYRYVHTWFRQRVLILQKIWPCSSLWIFYPVKVPVSPQSYTCITILVIYLKKHIQIIAQFHVLVEFDSWLFVH